MDERFILQQSDQPGWWVCTDQELMIVCRFKDHDFNGSQKFTLLNDETFDASTASKIARAMREMGDWLRDNHYDKVF